MNRTYSTLVVAVLAAAPLKAADPPTLPRTPPVVGEITGIDLATRRLDVRTDAGVTTTVAWDDKTVWLQAQPGVKDLSQASPTRPEELAVGDRVLARGAASGEPPVVRQIVRMARGDIGEKQERERAEWRRRGVSGVVQAVDPEAKRVTIRVASLAGGEPLAISTLERKATFRRYAPDSARFSDARPGGFDEIHVGDQLRALGDRTDGVPLAEQVVSGEFRMVAGEVAGVDAVAGKIRLKPYENGGEIEVTVGPEAALRRIPAEMAQRLAGRGPGAGAPPAPNGDAPPGGRRGRPGGSGDLVERLPEIALADLKNGDQILVSSPQGKDPRQITAIAVVAGIEAFARPGRGSSADTNLGLPPGVLDMAAGLQ